MSRRKGSEGNDGSAPVASGAQKSRKAVERAATFGLILVAVGLLAPFSDMFSDDTDLRLLRFFKWVYAAGALVFTIARIVGSSDTSESLKLRRLRRLEFWAGVAFCIGAFFWFYNEDRYSYYLNLGMGTLTCLRDTVYFTLAGGVIQIMAVFLLWRRMRSEKDKKE